jgi:hypothetical protein
VIEPWQIVSTSLFYLRAAQAYMLISMPTGTSTIFGAFQFISGLPSNLARGSRRAEPKTALDRAQVSA